VAIAAADRTPGGDQVPGDRPAHDAEPDERDPSDGVDHVSLTAIRWPQPAGPAPGPSPRPPPRKRGAGELASRFRSTPQMHAHALATALPLTACGEWDRVRVG